MKKFFLFAMFLLSFCGACSNSDDDGGGKSRTPVFTVDGVSEEIGFFGISTMDLSSGNYEIGFSPEPIGGSFSYDGFWAQERYFYLQLAGEHDGETVDLTRVDNRYEWAYYLLYQHDANSIYDGSGADEESLSAGSIEKGTLLVERLSSDGYDFHVKLDVTFRDGRTLSCDYRGGLTPIETFYPEE